MSRQVTNAKTDPALLAQCAASGQIEPDQLWQHFKAHELHDADGGMRRSGPDTVRLAPSAPPRLRVIANRRHSRLARGRRIGALLALSGVLLFLFFY